MPLFKHNYYHKETQGYFELMIPPNQKILVIGVDAKQILDSLVPSKGVMVILDPSNLSNASVFHDGSYECHTGFQMDEIVGNFDYIIIHHALSLCEDIGSFVMKLIEFCNPSTRIIVSCHNYLWKPLLRIGEKLGLKREGGLEIMLSGTDINNILSASGFQLISTTRTMLFPCHALGIGPVLNWIGKLLPFIDWLKINLFQKYRLLPAVPSDQKESLTVCLTCRDEKENIEPLVKAIPRLTDEQEILFVEGHSIDGTHEEIYRVMKLYPEKNIRVISQPGIGQGDAIREGFSRATGSIIILLEADMTSPPENIRYVYESMRLRYAEFMEGSRFIYPISRKAMPYLNQIGNWCFSFFFSWLFWRQITDVMSGIKAIRKEDFEKILVRWNSWGIDDPFGDFELLFGAMRLGLKSSEQPIHYHPRTYGSSKTRVFYHGYILTRMALKAFSKFRG